MALSEMPCGLLTLRTEEKRREKDERRNDLNYTNSSRVPSPPATAHDNINPYLSESTRTSALMTSLIPVHPAGLPSYFQVITLSTSETIQSSETQEHLGLLNILGLTEV